MFLLITYDVSTTDAKTGARRLRRVAKVCESFGIRVQKSVFECQVGRKEYIDLKDRLLNEIDKNLDSLRIYFLDSKEQARIEHFGIQAPPNLQFDTLIV